MAVLAFSSSIHSGLVSVRGWDFSFDYGKLVGNLEENSVLPGDIICIFL